MYRLLTRLFPRDPGHLQSPIDKRHPKKSGRFVILICVINCVSFCVAIVFSPGYAFDRH